MLDPYFSKVNSFLYIGQEFPSPRLSIRLRPALFTTTCARNRPARQTLTVRLLPWLAPLGR